MLFTGAADAMRRRALKPMAEWMAGRNQRDLRGLDVGCGTGRLLAFLHDAWPGLRLAGLDLSAPYLAEARRLIGRTARVKLIEGAAEKLPFDDASLDFVVSSFLMHELPDKIRRRGARRDGARAEARRPGVIVDSIQKGDLPSWDGLLDLFPHYFHEPYYAEYASGSLEEWGKAAGLKRSQRSAPSCRRWRPSAGARDEYMTGGSAPRHVQVRRAYCSSERTLESALAAPDQRCRPRTFRRILDPGSCSR